MTRLMAFSLLAATTLAASGCDLPFGDDDCDQLRYYDEPAYDPTVVLRNPETGDCESFTSEIYPPCDPECGGGCPGILTDQAAIPTWATCDGSCTGLTESNCLAAAQCRAVYADVDGVLAYRECWGTDTSGPVEGGACEGRGATECSLHDDCIAIHGDDCADPAGDCVGAFARCAAEPDEPNPAGLCYAEATCGLAMPDCPDGTLAGVLDGCYTNYCIPLAECESAPPCAQITAERTCILRADCTPIYTGQNCSCSGGSCTCQSWVYDSCSA